MVGIEVTPLDLAVQSRLLAVLLGYVVLLPFFEEPVGGGMWYRLRIESVFFGGIGTVAVVELLENFAAGLCPMLAFCMILGSFLYSIAILHQLNVLRYSVLASQ